MSEPTRRPFRVADLMVVAAALAVPLALYRALYPPVATWPLWRMQFHEWSLRVIFVSGVVSASWPWLASATVAALIFRRLGPRPIGVVEPGIDPGDLAALVAVASVALGIGLEGLARPAAFGQWPSWPDLEKPAGQQAVIRVVTLQFRAAGLAVAAAWIALGMSGRWRRSRDWVGRLALLCGGGWVAFGVLQTVVLVY